MPMSWTSTQSVPGLAIPDSCAVAPAIAFVVAPASGAQRLPAGKPTLIPIAIVSGGAADVSVTSIVPAAVVVKLCTSLPPTATVPLNVSVVRVVLAVVGVAVDDEAPLLPAHAATPTAAKTTSARQARPIHLRSRVTCASFGGQA